MDIVVEKDFEQRFKDILPILMGKSCLTLEVFVVVKGMLPKVSRIIIYLNDWSVCIYLMILNHDSSERMHGLLIMQWQCVHLELTVDGGTEHLTIKWKQC